jgi:phospholipase/carboxylesterase
MLKRLFIILSLITTLFLITEARRRYIPPALVYKLIKPKVITKSPMLIYLLHGYGSNENDLASLAQQLPNNAIIISVRAPINMGDSNYKWYDITEENGERKGNERQIEESTLAFSSLHNNLKNTYPKSKVAILGFSQGSIMAYHIATTQPITIDKVVALGGKMTAVTKEAYQPNKTKFFVGHGTKDERIKLEEARDAVSFLKSKKANCLFKTYVIGHSISDAEMKDVKKWLIKK